MNMKRALADLDVFRKGYLRNRYGLFFALVFPVILILLFGAIFSGGSSGPTPLYVQDLDGSSSQVSSAFIQALNSTSTVRVVLPPVDTSLNFTQFLSKQSTHAGMVIPQGFTADFVAGKPVNVTVYTSPADSSSPITYGTVTGVVNAFNLRRAGGSPVIGVQLLSVKSANYKYVDFLIPGLIGFSILTSPMFSMVSISSEYKKDKMFKQLSLTPLTKGEWLTSKVIWYTFLSILAFVLMTAIGTGLFGGHVGISAWVLPFLVAGPLMFVSLGMLVGTVTKSVESAGVIGNIITFPMMFLSGTFFPVSTMPTYLQNIAHVLPLFYLIEGLNDVMIYGNYQQAELDLAVILAFALVIFALAVRFFKWRED